MLKLFGVSDFGRREARRNQSADQSTHHRGKGSGHVTTTWGTKERRRQSTAPAVAKEIKPSMGKLRKERKVTMVEHVDSSKKKGKSGGRGGSRRKHGRGGVGFYGHRSKRQERENVK